MARRFPHTITFRTGGTPSIFNETTGAWSAEVLGTEVTIPCRARASKSGGVTRRIALQDGTVTESTFDLAFPKGSTVIPEQSIVLVKGVRGETLFNGPLLDYQQGDLSVIGWV